MCRFAGLVSPWNERELETPYCPKCILTRYVYENYKEIEKISKDADNIHPEMLDKDYDLFDEFGAFTFASVCMFLEGLNEEGLKFDVKPEELPEVVAETMSEDDYLKPKEKNKNIVFWCDKVIEWLEKQEESKRKSRKKSTVSKKKKPVKKKRQENERKYAEQSAGNQLLEVIGRGVCSV